LLPSPGNLLKKYLVVSHCLHLDAVLQEEEVKKHKRAEEEHRMETERNMEIIAKLVIYSNDLIFCV
jgi:hypothetical protein